MRLLPITQKENLIQIGYISASTELPLNSPDFLRGVSADDITTKAFIDLLKKYGYTAFSMIHIDDSYGHHAYKEIAKRAEEEKICINQAIAIPPNINENELSDVFAKLLDAAETKVIVAFTSTDSGNVIMRTANKRTIRKKFLWVASWAWGARPTLIDEESGIEPLGMMVFDYIYQENANYTSYMAHLKPHSNDRNMFFKEWWEKKFC